MIDFQDLKFRLKIEDAAVFLKLPLKQSGAQFRSPCPRCEGDDRSIVITPAKGVFYCFKAKIGGDLIALAAHIRSVDIKEAAELLARQAGMVPSKKEQVISTSTSSGFQPLTYLEPDHELVVAV